MAKSYIQKHIALVRLLNKPLTMEEFGLPRDNLLFSPGSTVSVRDNYFTALLGTVYDSAASGSPITGTNFWGWGGEGRSPNIDYTWRAGDPFVCDPPMEKQGLNSVFDIDSTTIRILRWYSTLMNALRVTNSISNENLVNDFVLYQNYPNPFNPITTFRFETKEWGLVTLKIYDVLGREVATLINQEKPSGVYSVSWNATDFFSGVYFYRLTASRLSKMKKAVLVK